MSDQPATLADELDAVIAEADAELAAAEAPKAPKGVDATEKAVLYASDFGVDITKVPGTGQEGKITVPDVQKYKKEMDALAEAEAEAAELAETDPVVVEEPVKKARKKPAKGKADTVALMPTLRTGLAEIYHIVRSLHEFGMGWDQQTVTVDTANEQIGKYLDDGWVIVHLQSLGVDMDGIRMLWVLGRPDESVEEKFWPYREIIHVTRPLGGAGDDGRGITGLDANAHISGYLQDGWDLAMVEALGMGTGVINMIWVLVR